MANPTQFRHYHIAQDAEGRNVEVVRSDAQVAVLAFDALRLTFVQCHVLIETVADQAAFEAHGNKLRTHGHPRLARVLECGEDEGSSFYITENVDGETLRSFLNRRDKIPLWAALQITILSLEAILALLKAGGLGSASFLDDLRILQTGPDTLGVQVADYQFKEVAGATTNAKQAQSAVLKHGQLLLGWFTEHKRTDTETEPAKVTGENFEDELIAVLRTCRPGTEPKIEHLLEQLANLQIPAPKGELPASLKPQPLLEPLLAGFQDVARSVVKTVRIQSQKLDSSRPYSMLGTLMKTGQQIMVEQVAPVGMTGRVPGEVLRLVRDLPRVGKFPNVVPILFIEENEGIECVAEPSVEGVTLQEVLAERRTLDSQEAYLVLAGVDAALAQVEKASLNMRRLRLEDIFLFTGFAKDSPRDSGLLTRKLNEWPGFSIVIRTHPCLHAMSGRGTDPAVLLPLDQRSQGDAEPIWNGAWMAALGCLLTGVPLQTSKETGIPETDTVFRLLKEEVGRAATGEASTRAAFLARFARVMQQFDLAQFSRSGGFWNELSGSSTAQGAAAEVSRAASKLPPVKRPGASVKAPLPPTPNNAAPERPTIGFAEALLKSDEVEDPTHQSMGAQFHRTQAPEGAYDVESSWSTLHEQSPFWVRLLMLLLGSLLLGAALAHLSGKAFWQKPLFAPKPALGVETDKTKPEAETKTPTSPPATSSAKPAASTPDKPLPGLPPAAPSTRTTPPPAGTRNAAAPSASPSPSARTNSPNVPVAVPVDDNPELNARLQQLRAYNMTVPASLRPQVEQSAQKGNAEAMLALGQLYLRGGEGVSANERQSFTWFDRAVQAGSSAAVVPLAESHLNGWGVEADPQKAVMLLEQASTAGDALAKNMLGVCYARGLGVTRDDARAFELCSAAYAAGIASACGNLGTLYLRGQGVTVDETRATQLFREGAERGHAVSMLCYAQSLEGGVGIASNMAEATRWYKKSAELGNAQAAEWCRGKSISF